MMLRCPEALLRTIEFRKSACLYYIRIKNAPQQKIDLSFHILHRRQAGGKLKKNLKISYKTFQNPGGTIKASPAGPRKEQERMIEKWIYKMKNV